MGNQQSENDKVSQNKDKILLKSVSKISVTNLIETDLENIDDFFDEEKEASSIDNLQRLWLRDSSLWTQTFNNKRDKFIKMVKLSKSFKIKNINNYEKDKEIIFQINAELNLNKEKFQFVLSKGYKSDNIKINQIKDFKDIEWILNIEWKDDNVIKAICESLKNNDNNQNDQNDQQIVEIVKEFSNYSLKWLASNNVEQFRIRNADKSLFEE